jgi:hypothetical protein
MAHMTDQLPAPDQILADANLSDAQIASILVDGFPLEIRMLVGGPVRELIQYAIGRERARAAGVLQSVAALQARQASGVGQQAVFASYGHRLLMTAAKMLQDPPGACARCGGRREVPSGLAGPGGQPLLSPCPSCSASPEESPASVSEISDAKLSEG